MIYKFSAKNYYSFNEPVTVSFVVDGHAPKDDSHIDGMFGQRVSLVEMVAGGNASGKTNVMRALSFLRFFIANSFSTDPTAPISLRPFGSMHDNGRPTELEVEFEAEGRYFHYFVSLTRKRILEERLREKQQRSERAVFSTIFKRKWVDSVDRHAYAGGEYFIDNTNLGVSPNALRENASAISSAYRENSEIGSLIAKYWMESVSTNVVEKGNHSEVLPRLPERVMERFFEDEELLTRVKAFLVKYDIGFSDFVEEVTDDNRRYSMRHDYSGGVGFELPLGYESAGTRQLLAVLMPILGALTSEGGVAIVDEIDANLHPNIVEDLVSLFISEGTNPNRSQLLFSSHNPLLMNLFSKYQITFTEKNDKGSTEVWRLDDMEGVRNEENYAMRYLRGAYRGVPNID